jgi:CRISPR-associated protein Cmr1
MLKKESEIFGSTDQKSSVKIQFTSTELGLSQDKLDRGNFNIYEYLAYGYRNGNNIRGHFISGILVFRFTQKPIILIRF